MKIHLLLLVLFLLIFSISNVALSQTDSLVMSNGDCLVGEIKSLTEGILEIETDYSDEDFRVEWDKVMFIKSDQVFLIITTEGGHYDGPIASDSTNLAKINIDDLKLGKVTIDKEDLVFLKEIDQTFFSRLSFEISLGYTLTKANNSNQFNFSVSTGYLSNKFNVDLYYNRISNFQSADDTLDIRSLRSEIGAGLAYIFVRDWFATMRSDLLQSTEQKLTLRAVTRAGIGNYLVNTQSQYLRCSGGGAWNFENYQDPALSDNSSIEAYLSLEYKIFDMGDLDLLTNIVAYPGISEKGRFRSDFSFNIKYEFDWDLFIKFGFVFNYDNRPVPDTDEFDYVLMTTVGWEW